MRLEASAPNLRREKRLIATVGGHGTVSAQPGNSKAGGVVRAENVCTIAPPEKAMPSMVHVCGCWTCRTRGEVMTRNR